MSKVKIKYKCIKIIVPLIILISNISYGQWNFNFAINSEFNNNPFLSPYPTASFINNYNLGIEKDIDSVKILYYGSYVMFNQIPERNYIWHQLGIYRNSNNFLWGVYAEQRINKTLFGFYDYSGLTAYINHTFWLGDYYSSINGSAKFISYSELPDLSNLFMNAGFTLNKSFFSSTTIIPSAIINHKIYSNSEIPIYDDENRLVDQTPFVSQLVLSARIAQSVTTTTGLAVQYINRNIFAGTSSQIKHMEFSYGDESQLYDDPISHEGYSIGVELTQMVTNDLILKAGFYKNEKNYPSQGIFTSEEEFDNNIMRLDNQQYGYLLIQKRFTFEILNNIESTMSLKYQILTNDSNSFWYNYENQSISFNIDFQF